MYWFYICVVDETDLTVDRYTLNKIIDRGSVKTRTDGRREKMNERNEGEEGEEQEQAEEKRANDEWKEKNVYIQTKQKPCSSLIEKLNLSSSSSPLPAFFLSALLTLCCSSHDHQHADSRIPKRV